MKILYLNLDHGIPVLGQKGASVHVRSFAGALVKLGHEVLVLCTRAGEGNPAPAPLIELPRPGEQAIAAEAALRKIAGFAPDGPAPEDRALIAELGRLALDRGLAAQAGDLLAARGFRPDLIYERHALFHHAGAALADAFDARRIVEVNAPLIDEQARFRTLRLAAIARRHESLSLCAADLVVAVSEPVAAYAGTCGVPRERLMIVPNGVDTAAFAPPAETVAPAGEGGAGGGGAGVVGFIGSFKPWHGIDFLLDAMEEVARRRPGIRLLALGEGPQLAAARERAAAMAIASSFPGAIAHADIPAALARMDLTVAPYLAQEDFYFSPLKVVESLAAGCPVVAPRIGQIPELVADGQTGLLYEPGDLAACRAAILRLLDDPAGRHRMGREAAARARRDWDWTRLADRVVRRAMRARAEALA